jgi:NTP pyrophosphatase (non-canonical NTP hydrolase)
MQRSEVYRHIDMERERQNQKWERPDGWTDHNFVKHAVLSEEVGEVAQEVLRLNDNDWRSSEITLRMELVQVAAVVVAWLEMFP